MAAPKLDVDVKAALSALGVDATLATVVTTAATAKVGSIWAVPVTAKDGEMVKVITPQGEDLRVVVMGGVALVALAMPGEYHVAADYGTAAVTAKA